MSTADFVLLMCASQQWKVFECEHIEEWMVLAGENTDDHDPMEGRLFNPAPNFINCRLINVSLTICLFLIFSLLISAISYVSCTTQRHPLGLYSVMERQ